MHICSIRIDFTLASTVRCYLKKLKNFIVNVFKENFQVLRMQDSKITSNKYLF